MEETPNPEQLAELARNPWDNVYWYARWFISSDFGRPGGTPATLSSLASGIETVLSLVADKNDASAIDTLSSTVRNVLLGRYDSMTGEPPRQAEKLRDLVARLEETMTTREDFEALLLTCRYILPPILSSLGRVPKDDRRFAESVARALLDNEGDKGLGSVINVWDTIGIRGCMEAERVEVVTQFGMLRQYLDNVLGEHNKDVVLSAFAQEFERRLGQARKGRAGRSLESVTSFIMHYYGIKASTAPEHFTTGLEIDRWVRTKDQWFIGISCKRTLRERWKQAYTSDTGLLSRHKIKALWHVLTYDNDLSDNKITEMGSYRAIFYLPDSSSRLAHALTHPGMKDYVRPMSHFIDDLQSEVGFGTPISELRRVAEHSDNENPY